MVLFVTEWMFVSKIDYICAKLTYVASAFGKNIL